MAESTEVASSDPRVVRAFIEERVTERARRNTAEQVQDTCSFARSERLLRREYHGRFLIELLQNAADAWREGRQPGVRSSVRIVIGEGPSLLVANQGRPFPKAAVIESLGQIGHSTKAPGEAIGHKGIGFKSVLEISLAPELYSGLGGPAPALAVRFDPREALELIRSHSPDWDKHLEAVDDIESPISAVPVLRYPMWVDDLPDDVGKLAEDGFDTVIRLPFDDQLRPEPNMDVTTWLRVVRTALGDLTDEMLLLLGMFNRLEIVDGRVDRHELIEPQWDTETRLPTGSTREQVTVTHDGSPKSRWRLYRRVLRDGHDLAGEIAVGLRCALDAEGLVPVVSGSASAPFHLFFPTRIGSGLPFLLHGYFEVNAARTGFYDGSAARNEAILEELAGLVAEAVADTAAEDSEAVATLPDILGEGAPPEDPHAAGFRALSLQLLDDLAWVPLEPGSGVPALAKPTEFLVEELDRISAAFSPAYVMRRTSLGVPSRRIGQSGHSFLMARRPESAPELWDSLAALLRPGAQGPWVSGEEDSRFRALLDLVAALDLRDRTRTDELLEGLRGDPESCLLPVVAADNGRLLLPVPDVGEGRAGRRSRLVMARARQVGGRPLIPPEAMDVAFLPDGLLASEAEIDRAKPLGVRDFTVDNVLDRLRGIGSRDAEPGSVLGFLWALLSRETRSDFSTLAAAERAVEFSPSAWFWCRPGHGGIDGPDAERQRRRRLLAATLVPARDGTWRPAGTLAFGSEWADWLESEACGTSTYASRTRANAYRALDAVCPDDSTILGVPAAVLPHLPDHGPLGESGDTDPAGLNAQKHAFLLTLGVWEVLPVEGFESREARNRERFPWSGPAHDLRAERIAEKDGWRFIHHPWSGGEHQNVWIAEDFRFGWSLATAAARDAAKTSELLSLGAGLYSQLDRASAFCPGCLSEGVRHVRRYQSALDEDYPSILAIELQTVPWVPAVIDGREVDEPQVASSVWWAERRLAGAGLHQSPLRYLPLCDPDAEVATELRVLAQIATLENASLGRLEDLLESLRHGFALGQLPVLPGSSSSARQAFVGLHRLAYERLAELADDDPDAVGFLEQIGVLCDLGDNLAFIRPPGDARHDDGRFVAYRRYFTGDVPFATLARGSSHVAERLKIPAFVVSLERRESDPGRDVTDEVTEILSDRIPELLAIAAHHSLGTQTLEPGSQQFAERARRFRNLRVRQVENLIIEASVIGTDATRTIGEGADEDVFLEGARSSQPVLFHDFVGEGWKEALRRKLAPHLAALIENPAYTATFALLLLAESDHEREDQLHELGITDDDVDAIRAEIGAVSDEEKRRQRRWFSAIVATLAGAEGLPSLGSEPTVEALTQAGLRADVAALLVERGGGEAVRGDASPDGALRLLADNNVALNELDHRLRSADANDGLTIDVARRLLSDWIRINRRRVSAVMVQRRPLDKAKVLPDSWTTPSSLRFELDPTPTEWLRPVIDSLAADGLEPDAEALSKEPAVELARLAGFSGAEDLEEQVELLFDPEERDRILRASAATWRSALRLLGVLARTHQGVSRAAIRAQADTVDGLLPAAPQSPIELRPSLDVLFEKHPELAAALSDLVANTLSPVPERSVIHRIASDHGLAMDHLEVVERALQGPRRELAQKLRGQMTQLRAEALRPQLPAGLRPADRKKKPDRRKVAAIKVTPSTDARKRRLGDEGERWALAAVLGELVQLEPSERRKAIEAIVALLDRFEGQPVEKARAHAESACEPQLDEDELIDELTELLHVSRHSDGFGFDLLGWLPPDEASEPRALCLEVKSTSDGTFHLSRSEWERAEGFKHAGEGDDYAVLVVHRTSGSGPPKRLDLLPDPVRLVEAGQLFKRDDSYEIAYRAD